MTADATADLTADPTDHRIHPGDGRPCASYTLRVNGFERPVTEAWIGESLLYVLRERLGLAGAKNGCEQGECGACSVQVDGQLVAGCLVPAALAADSEINTVEGLSAGGAASDVQQALADSGAVQCGYCTPGMAMAVHDLLQRNHRPSEVEARQALCGNLCRCTGYRSVLAAVSTVAQARGAALLEAEEAHTTEPAPASASAEAAAEASANAGSIEPQTAQHAPAQPAAEPVAQPVESEIPDLPVYQDTWAGSAPTGQVPPFGHDESGWIAAEPPAQDGGYQSTAAGTGVGVVPQQGGYPGYDPAAYGPGTVYDAGASYEPAPAHGTTAPGVPYEGAPGHGTPYEQTPYGATPAHGTPYDATPAHGTPYDATPAHGTPYPPGAPYAADPYATAPYGAAPYAGAPYDGTPGHGVTAQATPYDGTVYETPHGTQAHGLLSQPSAGGTPIPEDDHA